MLAHPIEKLQNFRGGVDYMYSGVTRRINIEKIKRRVTEDVVLLSSIGFRYIA